MSVLNETFFNEFTIRTPRDAKGLIDDLARRGVIGGLPVSRLAPNAGLDDLVVVAATEARQRRGSRGLRGRAGAMPVSRAPLAESRRYP